MTCSPLRCGILVVALGSVAAPLKTNTGASTPKVVLWKESCLSTDSYGVLVESWGHWEKSKMQNVYNSCQYLVMFALLFFCHVTLMLCPIWRYYVDETTAFVKNLAFLGCVLGGDVTYKCISNICLRSTFQRPLFTRQWSACMQGHEPPSPSHQCRLSHTYLPVKSFIPLITGQWLYQQLHQVFFYMLFTQIIWIIV